MTYAVTPRAHRCHRARYRESGSVSPPAPAPTHPILIPIAIGSRNHPLMKLTILCLHASLFHPSHPDSHQTLCLFFFGYRLYAFTRFFSPLSALPHSQFPTLLSPIARPLSSHLAPQILYQNPRPNPIPLPTSNPNNPAFFPHPIPSPSGTGTAWAESPITAYIGYLESSLVLDTSRQLQPQPPPFPSPGLLPSPPFPAFPSPRANALPLVLPSSGSQFVMPLSGAESPVTAYMRFLESSLLVSDTSRQLQPQPPPFPSPGLLPSPPFPAFHPREPTPYPVARAAVAELAVRHAVTGLQFVVLSPLLLSLSNS